MQPDGHFDTGGDRRRSHCSVSVVVHPELPIHCFSPLLWPRGGGRRKEVMSEEVELNSEHHSSEAEDTIQGVYWRMSNMSFFSAGRVRKGGLVLSADAHRWSSPSLAFSSWTKYLAAWPGNFFFQEKMWYQLLVELPKRSVLPFLFLSESGKHPQRLFGSQVFLPGQRSAGRISHLVHSFSTFTSWQIVIIIWWEQHLWVSSQ